MIVNVICLSHSFGLLEIRDKLAGKGGTGRDWEGPGATEKYIWRDREGLGGTWRDWEGLGRTWRDREDREGLDGTARDQDKRGKEIFGQINLG